MPDPQNIVTISISDRCGGAEKMAWDLFRAYRDRGHHSHLLVGEKHTADKDVSALSNHPRGAWYRGWRAVHHRLQTAADRWPSKIIDRLIPLATRLAQPGKWYDRMSGHDDFRHPGIYRLFEQVRFRPDVIHCHNLNGYYFDLRSLPWLSRQVPVVMSVHDAWLLSGLCGHSFDCDRWKTGCGKCPYLAVWQEPEWSTNDGTAYNWRRKKRIFSHSRLYITTACHWMAKKVEQSILAPAVQDLRIIPYGVDTDVFKPAPKEVARNALSIPVSARVFFFVARGLASNPSKDYATLRAAIIEVARRNADTDICFLARGDALPTEKFGRTEVRYVAWTTDADDVARYYQAADVYLHAAKMDTFPLSVLEAQACGTPVVASAVGGIPEQLKSLSTVFGMPEIRQADADEATGILVPPGDVTALVSAIEKLLQNEELRMRMGANAARGARAHFDLNRQVADYLAWYAELAKQKKRHSRSTSNVYGSQRSTEVVPVYTGTTGIA